MRTMLKITIPVGKGNDAVNSGALQQTLQATMERLKPEAAYFYPEDGKRTAIMVFDMKGSWEIPTLVEPLFMALGAAVTLTPVMNGDDLQRGLKEAGI